MLRKFLLSSFIFTSLYIGFGVFISGRAISVLPPLSAPVLANGYYDYAGVINVHSLKSSGSGSYAEIVAAAQRSSLDFVIVTDTADFSPDQNAGGYFDRTLLMIGGEYPYLDTRILNFGFENVEHLSGHGRSQIMLSEILSRSEQDTRKGLFVLAHPTKNGFEWRGELPPGLNGIEIFNLKSIWQTAWFEKKLSFLASLFVYPLHADWALLRLYNSYPKHEIAIWDQANLSKPLFGYAGPDADARLRLPWGKRVEFPTYETYFSILGNHVLLSSELTGKADDDKHKILSALRKGNFYVSLDLVGAPRGFSSYAVDRAGAKHLIGSSVKNADTLVVDIGEKPIVPFEVLIYQNGEVIVSSNSVKTVHKILSPGSYRAEVKTRIQLPFPDGREWITWILTNPIQAIN
jgi:hypothetical protein